MRLTELHPAWYGWRIEGGRIGVSLDCPVHREAHRVYVPFANPLEGRAEVRNYLWQRTGDTFDTLTLTPSVNYQMYDNNTPRDPSCWHGFITAGEVT